MVHPLRPDNQITGVLASSNVIKGNIRLPKMRQPCSAPPWKQRSPLPITEGLRFAGNYPHPCWPNACKCQRITFTGDKLNGRKAKVLKKSVFQHLDGISLLRLEFLIKNWNNQNLYHSNHASLHLHLGELVQGSGSQWAVNFPLTPGDIWQCLETLLVVAIGT